MDKLHIISHMEHEAIVKRVDHLTVRVQSPEPLFTTLTQQLLLPQAWPVNSYPLFSSGGLHLGNLNLEILQIGEQQKPARLYGLAFELAPYDVSLPALDERNILHTPPMPFVVVDEQGWQITAWTNVYLGGLLNSGTAERIFIPLSQHVPKETWERGMVPTAFNQRFGMPFIYDNVYKNGIISSVEYNRSWRAAHINQEPTRIGLDVQHVFEVTITTRNYAPAHACWKALLDPYPEIAPGVWELPDGMHIRLIEYKQDGLRRMIWKVGSLNRAAQFLNKHGMLGREKNGMLTIDPQKIQGLDIRLVQ